jgi:hypothetical protein
LDYAERCTAKILENVPLEYRAAAQWCVILPDMKGFGRIDKITPEDPYFVQSVTWFGRNRWYRYFPRATAIRFRIVATAPQQVDDWELWLTSQPFLEYLTKLEPVETSKRMGSNLAALQLVVDVADHLQIRERLPPTALSPSTIALLSSATSLLKWPCDYVESMRRHRQLERESGHLPSLELARRQLFRRWSLTALRTFSPTLKLAHELRSSLILLLQSLPNLRPSNALIATTSGTKETPPPAPASPKSEAKVLTVFLNKRGSDEMASEPLVRAFIRRKSTPYRLAENIVVN